MGKLPWNRQRQVSAALLNPGFTYTKRLGLFAGRSAPHKSPSPRWTEPKLDGEADPLGSTSVLCRQGATQSGRHIWDTTNAPTSNVRPEFQQSSGSAEALPTLETAGLFSRGSVACAETVRGRRTRLAKVVGGASRHLIQKRSHISAAIKLALTAQWAIWIPLTSWNTVGILDPIEPPNALRAVSAGPAKASQTMQ